jgi:hypothetical protein
MSDAEMAGAPGIATFAAMVRKELREGLRSFLASFAVVAIGLWFSLSLQRIMSASGAVVATATFTLSLFTITSALSALVIGGTQAVREARGDNFGFLTHRPVRRSTLFWGKAAAGILFYAVATGVPLAFATAWLATPGHRPMPYDPRMALPDIADLLSGIVYYFAAMLIGMREARWYKSGLLPVGAALACSTYVVATSSFPQAVVAIVVAAAVVGAAARGTFVAGGDYEPQSRGSRAALGVTVMAGLTIVAGMVIGIADLVATFGRPENREGRITAYAITGDGAVVQRVSTQRMFPPKMEVVAVNDLAGHPLEHYSDSLARANVTAGVISTAALPLNLNGRYFGAARSSGYRGTDDLFMQIIAPLTPSRLTPSELSWFYMRWLGLIAVYQNQSARLVGWVGPDGYSVGEAMPAHRFEGVLRPYAEIWYSQPLLAFPTEVYRLDLQRPSIRKVFTAPAGEEILGAVSSGDSTSTMTAYGARAQFDAIGTTQNVYVQSPDGTLQLSVPRDPRAAGYGDVVVARALKAPGSPTFFWYHLANGTLTAIQSSKETGRITSYGDDRRVLAQVTLPLAAVGRASQSDWSDIATAALTQPLGRKVARALYRRVSDPHASPRRTDVLLDVTVPILTSLVAATLAFLMGGVWAFDERRRRLWVALGVALGPLGALLMLSLMGWPIRERCASCSRKCVVTRVRCEHCDAPFPPPSPDGTEIFEPARS